MIERERGSHPTLGEFETSAEDWLQATCPRRSHGKQPYGSEEIDVAVFHDLDFDAEHQLLDRAMAWQRVKCDAGFGAISWPEEWGGRGLDDRYDAAFRALEQHYETPPLHETFSVTLNLIAPTILALGTAGQRSRWIRPFVYTSELCCQLFSEPEAGSDLASARTAAEMVGDEWIIRGQKVWTSGAGHSAWGLAICRSNQEAGKHAGLTAFMVPMDAPGLKVVPIRQMTGGSSFYEVFLDAVRVPDAFRLGGVGEGWKVALTTLGFERANAATGAAATGASLSDVLGLAGWLGVTEDPRWRQDLARLYTGDQLRRITALRAEAAREAGKPPGPAGSLSKLLWTHWMTDVARVTAAMLGPAITADTGRPGTYAWTGQLLGAPGYRIAGGSDEIQRNIVAERVLGLPGEPRR